MNIRVSAKSMRQLCRGCDPDYIATVCRGRCCRAPSNPDHTLVAIHPNEESRIVAHGGVVRNHLLIANPATERCPFQGDVGLCALHAAGEKPFGCTTGPFTVNRTGTLILRNYYKMLACFRGADRLVPAYRAYSEALAVALGEANATQVCRHLDDGGGDIYLEVADNLYDMMAKCNVLRWAGRYAIGRYWPDLGRLPATAAWTSRRAEESPHAVAAIAELLRWMQRLRVCGSCGHAPECNPTDVKATCDRWVPYWERPRG